MCVRHGPDLAPGEPAAERQSFGRCSVLVGPVREATRVAKASHPLTQ